MVCSICGQMGHNKTTCGRTAARGPARDPALAPARDPALAPARGGGGFGGMKSISIEDAGPKLKMIRKEQYDIAVSCVESLNLGKNCSIKAEEKTGKRMIMEAIHLIMLVNHGCKVLPEKSPPRSVYVTALNRRDTKEQFREQEDEFGICSIVATKHASLVAGIVEILNDTTNDGIIYIHLDECDYGTGADQSLSKLYTAPELNLPAHSGRIKYVTYSATPEELEFSDTIRDWDQHVFVPSKDYIGARWYLENDLVFEPESFFDGTSDISEHGRSRIEEVRDSCQACNPEEQRLRNVIVVRDTGKGNIHRVREMKDSLEKDLLCEIHVFDQSIAFQWGDPTSWKVLGRREQLDGNENHVRYDYVPTLIFISQICTRSTEICPLGHRKIAVWHDARKLEDKAAYNTISQAIGRVKHYSQEGHPVNRIKLYCDKDILNQTIGLELSTKKLKLAQRIQTTRKKQNKVTFVGYEGPEFTDKFTDVSSVGDSDWSEGDPNAGLLRPQYRNVDGKWCQYDMKPRFWNDTNHGGSGGDAGKQTTIQYKNPTSEQWMRRVALYEKTENVQVDGNKFEHKTKNSSMW